MNNYQKYVTSSQELWQNILKSTETVIWSVERLTGNIIYISDSAEIVYKRKVSDFLKNPHLWLEVIHSEDRQKVQSSINIIDSTNSLNLEYRIFRESENSLLEIRWLNFIAKLIHDADGKPIRIDIVSTDITEKKSSTQAEIIQISQRQYDSLWGEFKKNQIIFNTLPIGCFITDRNGNIINFNQNSELFVSSYLKNHHTINIGNLQLNIIRNDGTDLPVDEYPWVVAFKENKIVKISEIGVVQDNQKVCWLRVISTPIFNDYFGVFTTYMDITEWKKAQDNLQISEAKYRALVKDSGEAMLVADLQGNIIEANNKAIEILGYQQEELVQMHTSEIHPPEAHQRVIEAIIKTAKEGKTVLPNILALRKNGEWLWVDIIYKIIQLDNREKFYQVILQDITYYILTEATLRESEERFRAIFEQSVLGMVFASLSGKIFRVNQAFINILGYSNSDILMCDLVNFIKAEDQEISQINLRSLVAGEISTCSLETRFVHKNDSIIWIYLTISVIKNNQQPKYLIALLEDITERKQVELALRKSEERWQLALRGNNDGIWDWNIQSNEYFYLPPCQKILGGTDPEFSHHINDWKNRIHSDDIEKVNQLLQKHLDRQLSHFIAEYRIRCQDGSYKWILDRGQAIWDEELKPLRMVGSHTDITERKKSEEILWIQTQQEQLIRRITERIRQSLQLSEILKNTVDEVGSILGVERVIIQRKAPDKSAIVVAESLAVGLPSMLDWEINDYIIVTPLDIEAKKLDEVIAIPDIHQAKFRADYTKLLDFFQVKACVIIPIFVAQSTTDNHQEKSLFKVESSSDNDPVWGMLVAHSCSSQRKWEQREINLLEQLGIQLAIAIQQAQLYEKLQQNNQNLYKLATLDGLTQIPNRRYFDQYLEQEWLRMSREQKPLSLILCDIDFFKKYNDTYGHQKGDECLQKVAKTMSETIKRPADLVARYGGEELAVILPNTDLSGAIHLAEVIRHAVNNLQIEHQSSKVCNYITMSLGVSTIVPFPEASPKSLIATADVALYEAKETGRNQVVSYVGDLIVD
ncbi:MAG: PAS domain S-box protein [Microcoleaceae cyanobacterium MO_207.B10]|nr:PAS domain S-box protein [Microcoleaceae cyanobacterium MO_207.B10]